MNKNTASFTYTSKYAVLMKKMRNIRKPRRKQAAHFLPFDHKNIEKSGNGRGIIRVEEFQLFEATYGFSGPNVEGLRTGKFKAREKELNSKQISTKDLEDRRVSHRRITRECKVLKEML